MSQLIAASLVRDVPDFPKAGILFKDITPILANAAAVSEITDRFEEFARQVEANLIVGIESRGFLFGMPLAQRLGVGFAPVRKLGKLPADTIREEYALEYGVNTVEIHRDAISAGQRVLIVDDLLATGGTASAAVRLVERLGGVVAGIAFVVELDFLNGASALGAIPVISLIHFD